LLKPADQLADLVAEVGAGDADGVVAVHGDRRGISSVR